MRMERQPGAVGEPGGSLELCRRRERQPGAFQPGQRGSYDSLRPTRVSPKWDKIEGALPLPLFQRLNELAGVPGAPALGGGKKKKKKNIAPSASTLGKNETAFKPLSLTRGEGDGAGGGPPAAPRSPFSPSPHLEKFPLPPLPHLEKMKQRSNL